MHDTDAAPESTGAPDDSTSLPDENPNRPREYHGARTVIAGVGVVAAVAVALWLALLRPSDGGDGGPVALPFWLASTADAVGSQIGQTAPDFDLATADGQRFRLSDWRGQPVLINFWASWCGPCRREVPALIRAQDEHEASGFTVVGVNIEESVSVAQDFIDEFGMDYLVPMDFDGAVFRAYGGGGLSGPPRSFFIDPDGVIARIWAGQAPDDIVAAHTAEFAADFGSGQVGMLPGVKAPSVDRDSEQSDLPVAVEVGALAPDLLLADRAGQSWRLSDRHGSSDVELWFVPPGCSACVASLAADLSAADVDPLAGAILVRVDRTVSQLLWSSQAGDVFAPNAGLTRITIDPRGVLTNISTR